MGYNHSAGTISFDNLSFSLTTEYYSIWEKWFKEELKKTTLTTPHDYNVSVNTTAKNVVIELYGNGDGVQLYLEKTVVEVKI